MLMQNFGVTNKKHFGMLWFFLEWPITEIAPNKSPILYPCEPNRSPIQYGFLAGAKVIQYNVNLAYKSYHALLSFS